MGGFGATRGGPLPRQAFRSFLATAGDRGAQEWWPWASGTAVLMPSAAFHDVAEIENHFLVSSAARSGNPSVQHAGAGWTASGDFRSVEDWCHLETFAEHLANPIRVTVGFVTP